MVIISLVFVSILILIICYVIKIRRRKDIMSLKESLDLTGIPIVTFTQENVKYNFLLDTGSDISYINSKIVDNSAIKYEATDYKLTGFISAGGLSSSDIKIIDIPFEYKRTSFKESFAVLDLTESFAQIKEENGVTLHGILGNTFFTKYGYILDFKELKFYTK